ncbi:MAG: fibronectin type III domain-containing protein, partial [Clostridia bacterium]|nr:fibronectin type III domain-containing protein [Clostridia bacterium]
CTKTGLTEGKHCSVCKAVLVAQETVAALGHTEVTDEAVAATCTKTGLTEGKHCSVCKAVITAQKTVPATGHKPVAVKAVAATCTKSGLTAGKRCSVCKAVITAQKTVPATGHKPVAVKAVAATMSKNGKTAGKKCSVCNAVITKQTVIAKIKIVKLANASYTCTGKAIKPAVIVKDSNGKAIAAKYYTVTYKNNKNAGKAAVTVTFKGNYSGKKTLNFNILPKGTTVSKVTSTKKGVAKVTLKKQATQTTGYEIQYSTSKSFKSAKTVKIKNTGITAATIGKLTSKKTYYFRIRTYKTVSKVNYYSPWSSSKYVKVK